jgi:hypothetical protein
MTEDRLYNHKDKSFDFSQSDRQKGSVDQILIELKYTDILQRQVDYYNSRFFKNFQLRLEMDSVVK